MLDRFIYQFIAVLAVVLMFCCFAEEIKTKTTKTENYQPILRFIQNFLFMTEKCMERFSKLNRNENENNKMLYFTFSRIMKCYFTF